MKKSILVLAGAVFVLLMASCKEQKYYAMLNTADGRYIQGECGKMKTHNVEADLKFENTRIVYQERFDNDLEDKDVNNPKNSKMVNYMKDYTVYKAVSRYEADILVGTSFNISTSADGKYITVEVRGYPASYTNFRQASCCQGHHAAHPEMPVNVQAPGCGHEEAPAPAPAPEKKPVKKMNRR